MSYKVSRKFWTGIDTYPDYPHLLKRRFLDLSFILQYVGYANSILDIGCADCSMLILLKELTPIENFFGIDISDKLMRRMSGLNLHVSDLTKNYYEIPQTDVTICFGMFPYVFNDDNLYDILASIKSDLLLVRAPCTLKRKDEYINKFSVELNNEYSSLYRTKNSYKEILSKVFDVKKIIRSYPNKIEGKYDTKHYYFVCKK